MHILIDPVDIEAVRDRYVMLELDSFRVAHRDDPVTAFALIENVPIQDLSQAATLQQLHHKLMQNYRDANWAFCEQALEHLMGRWNGEIDSFYRDLQQRIERCQIDTPTTWTAEITIDAPSSKDAAV